MNLRVLLAESATEDILYLNDVLTELEGAPCWGDWVHLETSRTSTWADTAAVLATEAVDILLLNPDLPDSNGPETLRRAQAAASHVPVVLLVEDSATSSAERMVRDGAQDFLLKKEVDCAPLARAMRNALERHRLLTAARATCMTDPLTGLLTRPAFLTLANRDRLLAERLNRKMMIAVVECSESVIRAYDTHSQRDQRRDLALVEAADDLRAAAGPAALIARLSPCRFGLVVLDTLTESIDDVRARFQASAAEGKLQFGAAVFDPEDPVSLDVLLEQATLNLHPAANHATV